MTSKPILMRADMVLAILDGRKTQARRIIKPQPPMFAGSWYQRGPDHMWHEPKYPNRWWFVSPSGKENHVAPIDAPYAVGDHLWVRETWREVPTTAYRASEGVTYTINPSDPSSCAIYRAGWDRSGVWSWRPSIHMPKWASRITLEITDVRVEQIRDISDDDICADLGAPREWLGPGPEPYPRGHRGAWRQLWNIVNGEGAWETNPWVWVITFKRVAQ